ncbi:helix-turn-helix domain-containing protein [Yoonia sp. MH D7]
MNSIVYNSPKKHGSPYPYGVLAAGRSRFRHGDPKISDQFNEHTLILTIEGAGEIDTESYATLTAPRMLSWVDTSTAYSHGCADGEANWDYIWFSFEGHMVDALYTLLERRGQLHVLAGTDALAVFNLIVTNTASNHPGRHAQISSLISQCLSLFENSPRQLEFHDSLQNLARRMREDIAADWNTKSMADLAGLSVSRFHTVFRDEFGMPPATWIREQRLTAAKRFLTETDLDVAVVGEKCGYPDPHHFSREFAKNVSLPPSKFRMRMRSRVARSS